MDATSPHIQLYGRKAQRTAIEQWIEHGQSPLWVVGSPGVGKTTLVASCFAQCDVVWCVLRGAQDEDSICSALVHALGLGQVQDPVKQLNAALSGPDAPWLICDDATLCMNALDALLARLDQNASRHIVITTQHHKAGAHVLHVSPLAHEDALALFVSCVGDALPGWDAGDEEEALDKLVRQLGGVPLVLKLAARHMSLMSASDMSLALINDGAPFGQTLEQSMSWVWAALPEDARQLLICCAVVDGPMDLSCIKALCAGRIQSPAPILLTLIERSLICVRVGGQQRQFDMPGGVLHFVRHQARQDPEMTSPTRLIGWARQQLHQWRVDARGPRGLDAIEAHRALTVTFQKTIRLAQQQNQLIDALEMLLDHVELATSVVLNQVLQQLESLHGVWSSSNFLKARHHLAMARVLIALGRLHDARHLLLEVQSLCESEPALRVQWGLRWSLMCRDQGDVEVGIETLKVLMDKVDLQSQPVDAVELYSALGLLLLNTARFGREDAQARLAQSAFYLEAALKLVHHTNLSISVSCRDAHALCLHEQGRTRQGQVLLEALIDELEQAEVEAPLINVLSHASALAYFAGDFVAARRLVQKSLVLCQRRGHLGRHARQMSSDGVFALAAGQLDEAERVLLLAEAECARHDQKMSQLVAISQLVMLYAERDQYVDARRWSDVGLSLAQTLNAHGHQGLLLLWRAIVGVFDSPEARLAQVEEGASQLSMALEYQLPVEAPRWVQLKRMCTHRIALMQAEQFLNTHQLHKAHPLMERVQRDLATYTAESDPLLLVMFRQLKRASARLMTQHTIPAELVDVRSLIVGPNGLWFEIEGQRVSLAQRETLRRLFVALIEQWRPAPESSARLDVDALISVGWPGEVLEHQSAINRVYASIRLLRKLGLKGVLLTEDGGYLIDEMVHVVRVNA